MSFHIEAIHAFLAVDEDGEEGVIGMMTKAGWVPFVAADLKRLEELRPKAEDIALITNKRVRLAKFSIREDIDEIGPGEKWHSTSTTQTTG